MASTEKSFTGTGAAVTYTGILSGYRYEYDANNNLSKLICRMGNEEEPSWATTYVYDKDNRPTEVLLDNGKKIINTYDAIGRVTSRDLKNGNTTILGTTITYAPGANGSKTALVATYQNGTDDAYNYAYDENGNIIQIWRGSGTFDSAPEKYSYEYDAANQLVRENLYYGSGNSNNATYVYTYDQWGNILTKKRHLYTTGTPGGNGLLLGNYSYTDSQWGDLLTSYNGSTITYDAMGNPTSYLGKTLTWEGKQLTGYSHGSTSISYAYNEDGLRLQKIVNNETTEYCYNGSVLIGMKVGTGNTAKILRFSYDASGNAAAVDYSADNGSTFTTYYYVRNAQNDVVKLIDGSGNTVVEYLYDSWGKSISVTGTLATTLGADQPFRYRGYVYDEETGFYYLQSRYYDPTTCRFISADVLLSTGQGVIGHNSFAYCNNNPVEKEDSQGTRPKKNKHKEVSSWISSVDEWIDSLAKKLFGKNYYRNIDDAIKEWCKKNIPLTQKDHLERGGIIVSKTLLGRKYYSIKSTGSYKVDTCWPVFVKGYALQNANPFVSVEGFVHIHTAYLRSDGSWDPVDYGPSNPDRLLFLLSGISRQFLANEKGEIYEFYLWGNNRYL